jgi:hypothetical protein
MRGAVARATLDSFRLSEEGAPGRGSGAGVGDGVAVGANSNPAGSSAREATRAPSEGQAITEAFREVRTGSAHA